MCVELSTPEERAALDLSNWSTAMCGAEPVSSATLQNFADAFAPSGFRPEAFYPVYGMAEATLLVSGGSDSPVPVVRHIDRVALSERRIVEVAPEHPSAATLVGCGRPQGGQEVIIVDPETRRPCGADEVGEIWIAGPSVAQGYWGRPEQTEEAFSAHLAETGRGPFLRTGDLGFFRSGELFITGRRKDLIIIRGGNYYPEDIELTVQACHPALLRGRGAVFSVAPEPDVAEQLVVVQEVNHHQIAEAELTGIVDAIRTAITEHHEIQAHAVVLVEPLRIPTTSSGKIQRSACRQQFLDGELEAVVEWHTPLPGIHPAAARVASSEHGGRSAAEIADWFVSQLSRELDLPATDIDPSRPFAYYGLDSVHAVRLTGALESWLGRELSPTLAVRIPHDRPAFPSSGRGGPRRPHRRTGRGQRRRAGSRRGRADRDHWHRLPVSGCRRAGGLLAAAIGRRGRDQRDTAGPLGRRRLLRPGSVRTGHHGHPTGRFRARSRPVRLPVLRHLAEGVGANGPPAASAPGGGLGGVGRRRAGAGAACR